MNIAVQRCNPRFILIRAIKDRHSCLKINAHISICLQSSGGFFWQIKRLVSESMVSDLVFVLTNWEHGACASQLPATTPPFHSMNDSFIHISFDCPNSSITGLPYASRYVLLSCQGTGYFDKLRKEEPLLKKPFCCLTKGVHPNLLLWIYDTVTINCS